MSDPTPPIPARSKLEFLYRDLLNECTQAIGRTQDLTAKLETVAASLEHLPAALQRASAQAAEQVSTHATRELTDATRALVAADFQLRRTGSILHTTSHHNARVVITLAISSALFGGLLSGLIVALVLLG
jgi:hypothetical protein